jgi:hypothetical protein
MNRLQQQCAPPCAAQRGSTRHYLWVMSQPIAVSSRLAGLKHAGHDQSPVPAIAPRSPAISAVAPRFVPKSVPNILRRRLPDPNQPFLVSPEFRGVVFLDVTPSGLRFRTVSGSACRGCCDAVAACGRSKR